MPLTSSTIYQSSKATKPKVLHKGKGDLRLTKLNELARRAGLVIFEAQTVFPYTFFPDKLTICPNRITISYGSPVFQDELPMLVENVTGAEVSQGLMFATLSIETFGIPKPNPIKYLKKNDARTARRYILGLIECKKNGVDLGGMQIEILQKKLKEIGRVYK